jgi:hypothetical protein
MTQKSIETREIKIYADGIAGIVLDIIADMHMGGVHKDLNKALQKSQNEANRII